MEARMQHQRIRASSLSKTNKNMDTLKQSATPIKEELIEEDFEEMNSNSRTTGVVIEEAKNYDSVNESKQSQDPRKSILRNKSGDNKHTSQDSIKDEPSKLSQKPVSKFDEIPVEVDDEEYQDDDFEASSGSELLAKVSVS